MKMLMAPIRLRLKKGFLNLVGGILCVLCSSWIDAGYGAEQREPTDKVLMEALKRSKADTFYINMIQAGEQFVVVDHEQKIFMRSKIHDCRFTSNSLLERYFSFVYDSGASNAVVLTENDAAISDLFKLERRAPKNAADAIEIAIELSSLGRPNYRLFIPLRDQKEFDEVIESKKGIKFRPFVAEEIRSGEYFVTGLFVNGRDLVSRKIKVATAGIDITEELIESQACKLLRLHD